MKRLIIFFIIFLFSSFLYPQNKKFFKVGVIIYANPFMESLKGFQDGLNKIGYKDKIKFLVSNINGSLDKVSEILNDFYSNNIDLIFATTTPVNLTLKKLLKKDIPVIFNEVADPVGCGLVKSLLTSGNNFTGITHAAIELLPKRLEIFKDMFPKITNVYIFLNPIEEFLNKQLTYVEKPAKILGIKLIPLNVTNREEIKYILKNHKFNKETDGIFMGASALPMANVDLLIKISHKNQIPLMVIDNAILPKGGCVGYSPDFYSVGFQSSYIADKIFKGANPSDIPIEYPNKIQLVINLKEIKKLNLNFNKNYLIYADKIIK